MLRNYVLDIVFDTDDVNEEEFSHYLSNIKTCVDTKFGLLISDIHEVPRLGTTRSIPNPMPIAQPVEVACDDDEDVPF